MAPREPPGAARWPRALALAGTLGLAACRTVAPAADTPAERSPPSPASVAAAASAGPSPSTQQATTPERSSPREPGPAPTTAASPSYEPGDARGSASTSAKSPDGAILVTGRDGHARHAHGGPPARLGEAHFRVTNQSDRPRTLRPTKIEALRSDGCDVPSEVTARPKLTDVATEGYHDPAAPSREDLEIPPRAEIDLVVSFSPPVDAYMAWCQRFAFRVTFDLDGGGRLTAVAETHVARFEPRRR